MSSQSEQMLGQAMLNLALSEGHHKGLPEISDQYEIGNNKRLKKRFDIVAPLMDHGEPMTRGELASKLNMSLSGAAKWLKQIQSEIGCIESYSDPNTGKVFYVWSK